MKNFINKWVSFITTGLVAFSSTVGIVRGADNNPFEGAEGRGNLTFSNAWKAKSADYDTFISSLNNDDNKPNFMVRLPYTVANRVSNNPKTTVLILLASAAIPPSIWAWAMLSQNSGEKFNLEADYENDIGLDDNTTGETDT